jgi:hypothetical protein
MSQSAYAESEVYVGIDVYKTTTHRWQKAVNSASFDSTSWLWNMGIKDQKHKNRHRDTILVIPKTSIPEDITLVVWFHGCGGFSQKTFSNRLIPQIQNLVEAGNSLALAIPEMPWSINTSTRCGRQGQVWSRPGELEKHVVDLKNRLETWALISHGSELGIVRTIFVGHSAGGSALMTAAKEGSLCRLRPQAVVWSDASYGHWLDRAWNSCIKDTDTELHILVRKWDKPYQSAERVVKGIRRSRALPKANVYYQALDRKVWSHGRIGNSVFMLTDIFPPGC